MEYIYTALLLHSAGKEINEENVKKVLEAAGVNVEDARVKALVSALEGVDIDEAMNKAVVTAASSPAASSSDAEEKKEEKPKEEKKDEKSAEEAAAGLGALFG